MSYVIDRVSFLFIDLRCQHDFDCPSFLEKRSIFDYSFGYPEPQEP